MSNPTLYVAACLPAAGTGGVGTFEWRVDRAEAEKEFRTLLKDVRDELEEHAVVLFEYAPQATDPFEITEEIDGQIDELVLSKEGRLFARVGALVEAQQFAATRVTDHTSDAFEAWAAFHMEEGEGWPGVSYRGTFADDIEFTKDMVEDLADIPSWVVVDYNATSNIVTGYTVVDLPNGQKAYFR